MQLRAELEIATMIRAMREVVIPAVDPADRLAVEQSHLVVGMLRLLEHQLRVHFRFDRDELARLTASAERLERICASNGVLPERAERLAALAIEARDRIARSAVDPAELLVTSRALREEIGGLVSEAGDADDGIRERIEREILELSREQLLRDRALLAQQGFEPDSGLPAIEDLLENTETDERREPDRR